MKKFACLLVILSLALLVMAGCKESDVRKASRAAAGISTGLTELQTQNESWYAAKKLTPGETIAISLAIDDATKANDEFVAHIRALQQVDGTSATTLVIYAQSVVASVERLNLTVESVSDPGVQQKLQLVLTTIDASLSVLRTLLTEYPSVPPVKPVMLNSNSSLGGIDGREDGTARSRCAERRREAGGGVEGAGSFNRRAAARLCRDTGRELARPYTAVHFARQGRSSRLTS